MELCVGMRVRIKSHVISFVPRVSMAGTITGINHSDQYPYVVEFSDSEVGLYIRKELEFIGWEQLSFIL